MGPAHLPLRPGVVFLNKGVNGGRPHGVFGLYINVVSCVRELKLDGCSDLTLVVGAPGALEDQVVKSGDWRHVPEID